MKGKRVSLFTIALLFLLIPLATFAAGTQEPAGPIKIGVIQPLTGPIAFDGQSAVKGAELAAKEINAAGGILGGRMIELVVEDGACVPAQSVSAAEKLRR